MKHRATFSLIFRPDASLVRLYDGARDRQANSHALLLGREESIEYLIQFFVGNSGTGIQNRNNCGLSAIQLGSPDHAPPVRYRGHRIHAVHDQVHDDLLNLNLIAPHLK